MIWPCSFLITIPTPQLPVSDVSIMNTKREGNVDAHQIAPYAMSLRQEMIWKEDEPSFMVESMGNDRTSC